MAKSWVKFVVVNHWCGAFRSGFQASSIHTALAFQFFWGGEVKPV